MDNCCAERQFYNQHFPSANIKLDFFHAAFIYNYINFKYTKKELIKQLPVGKQEKLNGELKKLMAHAAKGCLSGIPPGQGTEANEGLHHLLNRSMLRGASSVYHHN